MSHILLLCYSIAYYVILCDTTLQDITGARALRRASLPLVLPRAEHPGAHAGPLWGFDYSSTNCNFIKK